MINVDDESLRRIFKNLKNNQSVQDIASQFDISIIEVKGLIQLLNTRGYDIELYSQNNELFIAKKNIIKTVNRVKPDIDKLNHIKLCILSDTHLGTTIQQMGLVNKVYREGYNRGITTFIHCGDVIDGDYTKVRPAQNYALFRRGFDEQAGYVVDMYPKVNGATTLFIEGSHDQTHVKNGGATPGLWITKLRPDMKYLGTPQALIDIDNVKILAQHPGGGAARSLSYKPQIAIDAMETSKKPNIFLQGHYHKAYGCLYRNVHGFLVPSLVDQSDFMAMNNIQNITGAYYFDIYADKNGDIEYFDVDPYRFTSKDMDPNDYKHVKQLVIK